MMNCLNWTRTIGFRLASLPPNQKTEWCFQWTSVTFATSSRRSEECPTLPHQAVANRAIIHQAVVLQAATHWAAVHQDNVHWENVHQVNLFKNVQLNQAIACPQSLQEKHQMNHIWFVVAIQSNFEASESKALNTREMLSVLWNEVARVATNRVECIGWIGCMFVTTLTKSPRQVHLNNVAELAYEPVKPSVYHILSKTLDRYKDGCVLRWAM